MPESFGLRSPGYPLYLQVREQLRDKIASLAAGDLIPTEPALCAAFGVSRITIRKAIDDLVGENLLIRKQGRGTFKAAPKLIHELNSITSWTDQLKALGYTPRTSERSVEEVSVPRQIAGLLQIEASETVTVLRRLRLADNEPITQMVNYIPTKLAPGLGKAMENSESLYQALADRYGLVAAHATDTVTTRAATDMECERLRIEPWAPVLSVMRVAFLDDGTPFEVTTALSRGDRFEYRVKLFRAGRPGGAGVL
jgi:GntR family transcriptional regulator